MSEIQWTLDAIQRIVNAKEVLSGVDYRSASVTSRARLQTCIEAAQTARGKFADKRQRLAEVLMQVDRCLERGDALLGHGIGEEFDYGKISTVCAASAYRRCMVEMDEAAEQVRKEGREFSRLVRG